VYFAPRRSRLTRLARWYPATGSGHTRVVSLPDFGEGSRTKRGTRRLSLAIGALVIAVIVALVIYWLAGQRSQVLGYNDAARA
jgi:hypothetical protein